MFNVIKRMRSLFIAVNTTALVLLGILSFQAEASTPSPVRTGIGAVADNAGVPIVFYQGFDGHLWGNARNGSPWAQAIDIGTPSSTVGIASAIGTNYAPGAHSWEAFVTGTDGKLWCAYQSGASWAWANFGTPSSTVGIAGAVGTIYTGSSWEAWVTGTDGNLWVAYQSGSTYAWSNFGKPSSTVGIASAIGTVLTSSGWEAWVKGTDGNLWLAYQSGSTYAWSNFGTPSSTVGIAGAIGTNYAPGFGWEAWVTGTDGNLWLAYQSGSTYVWSNFGTPSGTVGIAGAIKTVYANNGWNVFVIGTDSNLWCAAQAGTTWTWTNVSTQTVAAGAIYPKFKILSVEYAPPGSNSHVDYTGSNTRGTSSSITSSFTSAVAVNTSYSFYHTITTSLGGSWSQQDESSSSDSVGVTTSNSDSLRGTITIDHSSDIIRLWLNPAIVITNTNTSTAENSGPATARWGGFTNNPADISAGSDSNGNTNMDVVTLTVSQLKTLVQNPWTDLGKITQLLQRTWDTSKGYGGGSLTSNDYATILAADPFASGNYNPNTDNNKRFDGVGTTVDYAIGFTNGYSVKNSNISTQGKTSTNTYKLDFSTSGSFFGLENKLSTDFTWVDKHGSATTNTNETVASLTIVGPAAPDGLCPEFQVWRDNIYGAYMFYPVCQ